MTRILCIITLLAVSSLTAAAPRLEIVVGNEALVQGGSHLPQNFENFIRRLEVSGGWPLGTFHGKAYARPRDVIEHVRKNKSAFAILPPHQFVEGRKEFGFEILGRTVGLEGPRPGFWGVARNEKRPYSNIEDYPGLCLAVTEAYDIRWLRVLMEGYVPDPARHFKLLEVPTGREAVAAVLARKADVALIYEADFQPLRDRVDGRSDLAWVYASGTLPPPGVVATRWAPRPDRKRMSEVLDRLCKGDGADACGRMAILYAQSNRSELYRVVEQKYANY